MKDHKWLLVENRIMSEIKHYRTSGTSNVTGHIAYQSPCIKLKPPELVIKFYTKIFFTISLNAPPKDTLAAKTSGVFLWAPLGQVQTPVLHMSRIECKWRKIISLIGIHVKYGVWTGHKWGHNPLFIPVSEVNLFIRDSGLYLGVTTCETHHNSPNPNNSYKTKKNFTGSYTEVNFIEDDGTTP